MEQTSLKTATVHSLNLVGLACSPVEIEVDIAQGLPTFVIVGLPDTAVFEARDRVRSAIKNSGFSFPRTRVTVNLAPAHHRKEGSLLDLPIALGILSAAGEVAPSRDLFSVGELALDGRVRPIRGILPIIAEAARHHRSIMIPAGNTKEATLLNTGNVLPISSLQAALDHLNGKNIVKPLPPCEIPLNTPAGQAAAVDFADIVGQHVAKRALMIAAAGSHNVFISGPPGVGKSMLARALPSILPSMTKEEMLEATMVHSVAMQQPLEIIGSRPFRAPHHTASIASIIGGGHHLTPGEISLAHTGVLFFDELPEFPRPILEALRQPLEEGRIAIHRVHGSVTYPARFLFLAAANPCPCGRGEQQCVCAPQQVDRYAKRISAPLLDRFDIKVFVPAIASRDLAEAESHKRKKQLTTTSAQIQRAVSRARNCQMKRQKTANAFLTMKELVRVAPLDQRSQELLHDAMDRHHLSMRGRRKAIALARTIADLEESQEVKHPHVVEALSFVLPFGRP